MRGPLITLSQAGDDRDEGMALARYIEGLLSASTAGWGGIEIRTRTAAAAEPSELLGATAAGGTLPFPVISLDLDAAADLAHARQHLMLRDTEESLEAAMSGPERALAMHRLLRQAKSLVAFDTAAAERLRQIGCRVGAVVPMPALPPSAQGGRTVLPPSARGVLVINHLGPDAAVRRVLDVLRCMTRGGTIPIGTARAQSPGLDSVLPWHAAGATQVAVHLHVGTPPEQTGGAPRLVDSFACRRPVLLHLPDSVAHGGAARPQPIAHEVDGLVSTSEADLLSALTALTDDRVFGDILARNADRRVQAFNQGCAAVLREAVPELFG